MPAPPPRTCLLYLDDFILRLPPLKDCPETKTYGSNCENIIGKEHSQPQSVQPLDTLAQYGKRLPLLQGGLPATSGTQRGPTRDTGDP